MKKCEIATLLNNTLNLYSDYMETGFISHHDDNFDFNYIDEILTKEEENKNVEIIEKNIIDSFNNNSQSNNLIKHQKMLSRKGL